MSHSMWHLDPGRLFDAEPTQRAAARAIFEAAAELPLICPHTHVHASLFSSEGATLGTPAAVFVVHDHYVLRMLYSQGIHLESLGVPRVDGHWTEQNHRQIWQVFAEHFHLFRGTPCGLWLKQELIQVFGIQQRLTGETAQAVYDELEEKLALPPFHPRSLFERFNIEVLTTTDGPTDTLDHHKGIAASGWGADIRPTFRPDAETNLTSENWRNQIERLVLASGVTVRSYGTFVQALQARRQYFKMMGATATDHAACSAYTEELSRREAETIFQRGLRGEATDEDARRFTGHMLMEFARMSVEDGLVMQLHIGSVRNHNEQLYRRFGPDVGADIPRPLEFTDNLRALLNRYGNDSRLRLIVFTLDESAYARELAPLAGHYPALRLGPPWWFHDSPNGIRRYFDRVVETAGLQNTVGFNDDARAFLSIPARHDVWRRTAASWIGGLIAGGLVDLAAGKEMMLDVAYRLAKRAYRFDENRSEFLVHTKREGRDD